MNEYSEKNSVDLSAYLENQNLGGKSKLWKGYGPTLIQKPGDSKILDSGYEKLNDALHNNGWPTAVLTEIGLAQPGIGELRLLMPALSALSQSHSSQQTHILWINPPFLPFAPALLKENIDFSRLTIIKTKNISDALWAAEQGLLSQSCAAVICWTEKHNLPIKTLRRLQLAAEKSSTWNILFRHSNCMKQASGAGLRLQLQSDRYSQLDIHILKQPFSWGGQKCTLSLSPHYEKWQRIDVSLLANKPTYRDLKGTLGNTVSVLAPISKLQSVH